MIRKPSNKLNIRRRALNFARTNIAVEINIIKKIPLTVFNIGSTIFSATLLILTKIEAERSVFLFSIKNSYCWESKFLRANSERSLQIVALSFNCFALTYSLMNEENQLPIIKIDISIKILYFGSKSRRLLKYGIASLGWPLKKLNNHERIVKTKISDTPATRASGINEYNSFLLDLGKRENISKT